MENPPAFQPTRERVYSRPVQVASYVLMAGALLICLTAHLLTGLLAVCVGFLAARWFARWILAGLTPLAGRLLSPRRLGQIADVLAVLLLVASPIAILTGTLSQSREVMLYAPQQYRELLDYVARTVLELRSKLSPDMAVYLPDGVGDLQKLVARYLSAQAGSLAMAGRAWLNALLFAYVGLIVGSVAAVTRRNMASGPLALALRDRVTLFGEAFGQIVAAQFWIASLNTVLTAIFLLFVLPLWNQHLPYTPALITLTFLGGLVPIVGNLICNGVITIVGLSVSPLTGAACLAFLILIHKAEYFINAKVVGRRTHMAVWELLAVMFAAEAVFGPAGLVAAPLFYAYLKKELQAGGLV
ncbi:AI-2E family transporter [Variovorax sp. OV329]|uniref:AI-2E family transporter n=1 Tax=Variovorax sp. OV329 TaxID=1882825 RepID=UPI0008ED607E|nr:AI-2E family transporter [Variovorax sp. OV329]SFM07983.1 Predicted PurR-regulated permease PerM [Variovorax sp. OV329]